MHPNTPIAAGYDYTFADFKALMLARRARVGVRWWTKYAVTSGLFLLATVATNWWDGSLAHVLQGGLPALRLAGAIVLACWGALLAFIWLVSKLFDEGLARLVFRRYAVAGKHISLSIGDSGIAWTAGSLSGLAGWPALQSLSVIEQPPIAVVWLGKVEGIVLPGRGFATAQQFKAACDVIEGHLKAHETR